MKRTYIDSCVLITAFQGQDEISIRAMRVLDDPARALVVSDFLRLEVLPKPIFTRHQDEVDFMLSVLEDGVENVPASPVLTTKAVELAAKYDMTPIDALHVSAAMMAEVDELVTLEADTKPMCRVQEIKVTSIL